MAVGGLVYVVLTPIIVARLGTEAYAVWILIHAITFYLEFLDLGFSQPQVRYHAGFAAQDDQPAVRSLIATTAALLVVAGVIGALLAAVIALSPAWTRIGVPASLAGDFRVVLLILGFNLLLSLPVFGVDHAVPRPQRIPVAAAVRWFEVPCGCGPGAPVLCSRSMVVFAVRLSHRARTERPRAVEEQGVIIVPHAIAKYLMSYLRLSSGILTTILRAESSMSRANASHTREQPVARIPARCRSAP